jgi:hypothetical protein
VAAPRLSPDTEALLDLIAKTGTYQKLRKAVAVWVSSYRSMPRSAVGDPLAELVPGSGSMTLNVSGSPGASRTIVDWEVQRLIASVWTTVTAPRVPVASVLPARSTRTPTKWVHPSGTLDGNTAYTTIQAALNAATAGDEIVVGQATYNERCIITVSGTSGNRIRIRPFDYNNPPTIDGQTSVSPPGWDGSTAGSAHLFAIQASYVTLDGLILANSNEHGVGLGDCANNGYFASQTTTWYEGIEVLRCKFEDGDGIAVTTLMASDYKIDGNDFYGWERDNKWDHASGNPSGYSSAISLLGRDAYFRENVVRQSMGEGIHVGAHVDMIPGGTSAALGCNRFTITGNKVYDCWAPLCYVTLGNDGLIDGNLFFYTDDDRFWYGRDTATGYPNVAFQIGCELGAFGNPTVEHFGAYAGVRNVVIRNNILNGANQLFKLVRFADDGNYKDIDIEHNTIFACQGAFPSVYEALFNNATAAGNEMTGIRFRNNIVAVSDASDISITWNALGSGKVVQGNVWSHSPPSDLAGTGDITNSGAVINDKTYLVGGTTYPTEATFNLAKATPDVGAVSVNAVASIGTPTDYYGYPRPTHTGNADAGAISLSQANSSTRRETGLGSGTSFTYRARYRKDDGSWSGYSDPKTAATL